MAFEPIYIKSGIKMTVNEQKIKEVTRRYLKEYLDKDWMVPLKRFMNMDDTEKAIQCAYLTYSHD